MLVADHKGHSALGVVEDLSERSLLPLQVQILELHPVQADGEVNVREVPHNLYSEERLCGRPLCRCRPLKRCEEKRNNISIDLVNISLLNGTLHSHVGQRRRLPLPDQRVPGELGRVVQGEVHLGAQHLKPPPRPVKLLVRSHSEGLQG